MLLDVPCTDCGGSGTIPGIAGWDDKGEIVEGHFPCVRCNGEGKEVVWFQDCTRCEKTGFIIQGYGEEICPKCLGRGCFEPESSPKMSRWEKISE